MNADVLYYVTLQSEYMYNITVLQMIFRMDGHFQASPIAFGKIVTVHL